MSEQNNLNIDRAQIKALGEAFERERQRKESQGKSTDADKAKESQKKKEAELSKKSDLKGLAAYINMR